MALRAPDEATANELARVAPKTRSPLRGGATVALSAGTLAAALAVIPAALRVPASGLAWVVLAGACALVLGPALAGLARARPLTVALFSVLTGIGLAALPLAVLATRLKLVTHHRPLGAVTFAVLATAVVLGSIAVTLRLTTWTVGRGGGPGSAWIRAGIALLALAGPALLLGSVASAATARTSVLDVGLALASAAVLGFSPWPASLVKLASRAALPLWAALVGAGLWVGLSGGGEVARLASPALFAPFGWLVY
ncbi:MAG TPA: hypothetical protein VIM73_07080 [Polyangiaceae bacterium]